MAEQKTKRYLEMQLDELKTEYGEEADQSTTTSKDNKNEKNAKIAEIYEDCWEYEEDLAGFEAELEIVKANDLNEIAQALIEAFPGEERDYAQELQTVVQNTWINLVEVEQSHPQEQLDLIRSTSFCELVDKFNTAFSDYKGDFKAEVREALIKRWEMLISIKKAHIKEELAEIKTMGLKPNYVKRIYKQYHNID